MISAAYAIAAAFGFAASASATLAVERVARRRGLFDQPDAARRTHTTPTPRLGGIGMLVGIGAALAALAALGRPVHVPLPWLVGGLGFFLVGLADDLSPRGRGLSPRWKFVALAAVATLVVVLGARFDGAAFRPWPRLEFGVALAPLTVLWFLAVANVVNFIDGIDGLAGTVAAVLLATACATGPGSVAPIEAAAAGASIGFLLWNAPRARIFMGDGGAYLLGFLVAVAPCGVGDVEGAATSGAPWPLLGAGLIASIVDVAEALLHKLRVGVPLSQPHHDHLYQRLVKAGHPPSLVALRYGALTLAAVAIAGPLARSVGAMAATAVGLVVLGAHWLLGARAVRAVPRLARESEGR